MALLLVAFLSLSHLVSSQASPQNNTFNSTFTLSAAQIAQSSLDPTTANAVETALNFERSNWAADSALSDPFYAVPPNASALPAGALLKTQLYVNTTAYTLAPNLALSRILYQTETLNGTTVPASAFVLWPWLPRVFSNISGHPVVAWAHGTSGTFAECGPSHIRNLWYQYNAPYTLALQGYVVIAPDYAGLGVSRDAAGVAVNHTYLANPAAANDLFFAVEAARTAFPELAKEFVAMGHSQGGGAAYACAERQVARPVEGYLGAVAGSPALNLTELLAELVAAGANVSAAAVDFAADIAQGLGSIFPEFEPGQWFTPEGLARLELLQELQGCNSVVGELFAAEGLVKPEWANDTYARRYAELASVSGRRTAGPVLVLQGTADPSVSVNSVDAAVNQTCRAFPDSSIEYVLFEGVSHVPVLNAGQQIWLDWIADRFRGVVVEKECRTQTLRPVRQSEEYQRDLNFFLELATQAYEVA